MGGCQLDSLECSCPWLYTFTFLACVVRKLYIPMLKIPVNKTLSISGGTIRATRGLDGT